LFAGPWSSVPDRSLLGESAACMQSGLRSPEPVGREQRAHHQRERTGKELVARAIPRGESPRGQPFVQSLRSHPDATPRSQLFEDAASGMLRS